MLQKFVSRILILFVSLFTMSAMADEAQYGHTTFPNSGADEAQPYFMEGLLMLHSFEYSDARKAFQKAREIDAGFAMAYWGEAMTYYRVLWNEIELDKARAVLAELGETPQVRANKAETRRERDYVAALEVLLEESSDAERATAFADAMETLAADNPDDENAAAFYALALLGSSGPDRDFAIYMKSAAVSEAVIARNPLHPGAVHYLIHAYDDPIHAPLGLRPALTYADIAPAATHALHMPSHIFFPLGMWDEATRTNLKSFAAGKAWGERNDKPVNGGGAHALSWLVYSLLQEGKYKSARDHLQQFQDIVAEDAARGGQFVETWAAYLVDTEYGDADFVDLEFDADKMPARRSSMYYYVKAAAAIKAGDLDNAKIYHEHLAGLEMKLNDLNWSEKAKDVMLLELKALMHNAQGNTDQAVRLLQQAAEIEYAMPRRFGPPWPPQPSHELLGEVLAEQGEYDAAMQQFKIALSLAKARSASLLGLARASAALDQDDESRRAYEALATNWSAADTKLPALIEARNLNGSTQ